MLAHSFVFLIQYQPCRDHQKLLLNKTMISLKHWQMLRSNSHRLNKKCLADAAFFLLWLDNCSGWKFCNQLRKIGDLLSVLDVPMCCKSYNFRSYVIQNSITQSNVLGRIASSANGSILQISALSKKRAITSRKLHLPNDCRHILTENSNNVRVEACTVLPACVCRWQCFAECSNDVINLQLFKDVRYPCLLKKKTVVWQSCTYLWF